MSVRINNNAANYLTRATDLPATFGGATWAMMAWVYFIALPANNGYAALFGLDRNANTDYDWLYVKTISNNPRLLLEVDNGTYSEINGTTTVLAINTWYHLAIVRESNTSLKGYINGNLEVTSTTNQTSTAVPTAWRCGGFPFWGDTISARFAAFKHWRKSLAQNEIWREMRRILPQDYASLSAFYPMHAGATERLRDYSVNARNFTAAGTLTDEAGPPLPVMYPQLGMPWKVAAGGGGDTQLVVADVAQSQAAEAPALTQQHLLAVADAAQVQAVDSAALTQAHLIAVADVSQAQAADNITLDVGAVLEVQDAAQAQVADNAALTQAHVLGVADAAQAQTPDTVALVQAYVLAPADAAQAQTVDSPALVQAHTLTVADAGQTQATDNVSLTQAFVLTVADAAQAQAADNVTVDTGTVLVVADVAQAQAAESPALTQAYVLTVAEAHQAQAVDQAALAQAYLLAVQDAAQAQAADTVTLNPPAPVPPVTDDDAAWLFTSSRRRERVEAPNPWDTLNAWLVAANERQVDQRRVAAVLRSDERDLADMQVVSRLRRRRK